ncbi:MAG TPA: glycosyltransferase family 2 protein [Candidatus Paceibacterota bacterium]|nr:glycosyltransferase family 2 protein [Candidatus Paceibacterota bacterium]
MFNFSLSLPMLQGVFDNPLGRYFLSFNIFFQSYILKIVAVIALIFFLRMAFVFLTNQKKWQKKKNFFSDLTIEEVKNLAQKKGLSLPSFTVLIPAREEALVIKSTLFRIAQINYPLDKMEIVVITDEKERQKRVNNQPITQEEVENAIKELTKEKKGLKIHHLEIPYDYDGELFGRQLFKEVPSTKGRALNYALTSFHSSDFCAFFDTDDYPHQNCLLSVAYEYLKDNKKVLFQMPIFQCRNFFSISTFSKIISLGQAFTHEYFLPWILTWLPFLGGTNFFVKTNYLIQAGGFRLDSITEDLELGTRLYLKENIWPIFLPLASSEQTPPNFKSYFHQRQRWGLGQMKVLADLSQMVKDPGENPEIKTKARQLYYKLIAYGPLEWLIYFAITALSSFSLIISFIRVLLVVSFLNTFYSASFLIIGKEFLNSLFSIISFPLLIMTALLFFHYRSYIAKPKISWQLAGNIGKTLLEMFFIIPFVLFLYPLPFVSAFFKHFIRKQKEPLWVKTPRTAEVIK